MRSFKAEGIIIKRKNFGEADRIITVLTRNQGKIQIKAAGVRKIQSRRSPHVELLNHSILFIYKGRGNLPVLTEAQTVNSFQDIKNDLTKTGFAL
ncbi:MAG: DNA repair protein RecO [Patescibacteria group bacterium]|nr:DNA repair protein RecO [Patescibacteria group bacterium]